MRVPLAVLERGGGGDMCRGREHHGKAGVERGLQLGIIIIIIIILLFILVIMVVEVLVVY